MAIRLVGDVAALLADAPRAVESFSSGHWALMQELERRAPAVVAQRDLATAASFFAQVVFLKRPHTTDQASTRQSVLAYPGEVLGALDALARVDELGYAVMDDVARVPWFGRGGGRSFNSAVLRLVCPASFGIVDWRNVAVLCGASGFDGLVAPPVTFSQFSREEVVALRGHLPFTPEVYRQYNDVLRSLAVAYGLRAADIDLVLWAYSIQRQPFLQFTLPVLPSILPSRGIDRESLRRDHHPVASELVAGYLARLGEAGYLSRDQVVAELCSVFALIRDECALFGRTKRGKLKEKVTLVVMTLDEAIASRQPARLLAQWRRWQDMVDPAAPGWSGISLPAEMIMGGFLVLEDFAAVKEYIESYYEAVREPSELMGAAMSREHSERVR